MPDDLSSWIFAMLATALALLGLFLCSAASDVGIVLFSVGLMAFGVLFDFWLIKAHYDRLEASLDRGPQP